MEAKIRNRVKSLAERLKRLAVVFAVELRLKIIIELSQREMSPKEFYEEFGGGSLSRVSRNFDRLLETGWLRHMRSEGPGGARRGGVEHFYRATGLAFFDRETWGALPYSVRVAFSWKLFSQIAIWLKEGVEAEMLETRAGSSLGSRTLVLDQPGCERVIGAFSDVFAQIFEEQYDAKLRVAGTKQDLIRASVLQFAYESPTRDSVATLDGLAEIPEPMSSLWVRASRIFLDAACMDIIDEANQRTISATEFHEKFGGNIDRTRRLFRKTAENGWLKEVDRKTGGQRRGATEKFYRATRPVFAKADKFLADLPESIRRTDAGQAFERICVDFVAAMEAETVDRRDDRYVALSLVQLDERGWERVAELIRGLWAVVRREERESKGRLRKSGDRSVSMTVALGLYETAKSTTKEP